MADWDDNAISAWLFHPATNTSKIKRIVLRFLDDTLPPRKIYIYTSSSGADVSAELGNLELTRLLSQDENLGYLCLVCETTGALVKIPRGTQHFEPLGNPFPC